MDVKKIIIISVIILIIVAASFFAIDRLQKFNRGRVADAVQAGIDNLRELEEKQREINRGFERTITTQRRILADRQETIRERELELERTNEIIRRLTDSGNSEQGSLDRLGQIHSELERRNSETGE